MTAISGSTDSQRAVVYLRSLQNGDGGWGQSKGRSSNAQSTAWAVQGLEAAATNGVDCVVLCDTRGGSLPHEVQRITAEVSTFLGDVQVGIHTQNDSGCAVANSVVAVLGGATQVQGTVNGYGERTGNANLMTVIPDLTLKLGVATLPEGHLDRLTVPEIDPLVDADVFRQDFFGLRPVFTGHNTDRQAGRAAVVSQPTDRELQLQPAHGGRQQNQLHIAAGGSQNQQRKLPDDREHALQRRNARLVRPLQIVEHDRQRQERDNEQPLGQTLEDRAADTAVEPGSDTDHRADDDGDERGR